MKISTIAMILGVLSLLLIVGCQAESRSGQYANYNVPQQQPQSAGGCGVVAPAKGITPQVIQVNPSL